MITEVTKAGKRWGKMLSMIPVHLKLSGFLSYRQPVEVDFTSFDLACISGHNGAGKSSLLDAITWALFGEARKRGEEILNAVSEQAEIIFTFAYETDTYRIRRSLSRGKSAVLELQILDESRWRPLTEATSRATQAKIEAILRLDYDTFINASFFLQGKADQFTQQKPSERKRILASILGLEVWETYKIRAAERRKALEDDLRTVEGRLAEINEELSQESSRLQRLQEQRARLAEVETLRQAQETILNQARGLQQSLAAQRRLTENLGNALEKTRRNWNDRQKQMTAKEAEYNTQAELLARAPEVESRYRAWEQTRADLAGWEERAQTFYRLEQRREAHNNAIRTEGALLQQEQASLRAQAAQAEKLQQDLPNLQAQHLQAKNSLAEAEEQIRQRSAHQETLTQERERHTWLDAENRQLKTVMDELKQRIDAFSALDAAVCPLCGQPLSEAHRETTLEDLQTQGKTMGDQWRNNRAEMDSLASHIKELETQIKQLAPAEQERLRLAALASSLAERSETASKAWTEWLAGGANRLREVESLLEAESYAAEARSSLSETMAELAQLGYLPAAHEAMRQEERQGRAAEQEWHTLQKSEETRKGLQTLLDTLRPEQARLQAEMDEQESAYASAVADLQALESQAPNLQEAERAFLDLKERENRLHQEVGMAQQLVQVLESRRGQKKGYEAEREEMARQVGQYQKLERAFGKDGVPALLIEQALPQIEERANELLDSLSNGAMSVRFVTQAEYKDKKREDLKETLDIRISDPAGTRDYEMFSGGEAFRVNFAIRLALSEVLARRTGARLQTLVIDEGFGSQDAEGVQRLVEAINTVRRDFAKILVITHLDTLKDAFPNRIEVEKTPLGSRVQVI